MFSIFVKQKIFTKQLWSQWTSLVSFTSEVIAAVQPFSAQRRPRIERGNVLHLFSEFDRRAPYVLAGRRRYCCARRRETREYASCA
jgi:hypothetical protein